MFRKFTNSIEQFFQINNKYHQQYLKDCSRLIKNRRIPFKFLKQSTINQINKIEINYQQKQQVKKQHILQILRKKSNIMQEQKQLQFNMADFLSSEQYCRTLSKLCLSFEKQNIRNNGFLLINSSLAKCTNLQALNLNLFQNNLGENSAYNLALTLENYTFLETLELDLGQNSIGSKGLQYLAQALSKLTNLQILNMNLRYKLFINFFQEICQQLADKLELPHSFVQYQKLQVTYCNLLFTIKLQYMTENGYFQLIYLEQQ
ncbi:hypothetical protein TTHERM_000559753 (macronuclear) [Tetrahymena thermophila SB210]|uniref:Kinase domain protein n=1 Tax=Tetrahymena thermophila (strain SB210) TaxID=312017 RepID=W7XL90_TETTS|nr:hypothetical protein TTHERM_000559753 [Tetrahymena thermophila SB210]EWS75874.1 hypothetical protein TTHERM_000559753 [Tetrahymena thermophila SB210]|eukprot:XP_012651577.1 hypothetical protein TTHERM_000559753 [Tetrahymena thermophila SB210]